MVGSGQKIFYAHRPQAPAPLAGVARAFAQALAFPRRLSLGFQCQSVYLSGDRLQKGHRPDEGIPTRPTHAQLGAVVFRRWFRHSRVLSARENILSERAPTM